MFGVPFNINRPPPRPLASRPVIPSPQGGPSTLRDHARPSSTACSFEDPSLRATFGSLRVLDSALPKEYIVGRAPECDLILAGKYSDMISRKHCKLIWNSTQTHIVDLNSVNGTWVNFRRLADNEVRVLRHKDRISFTPVPFDGRPKYNATGAAFFDSTLGQAHALEYLYLEHNIDTLARRLSPVGRIVRQSLDELQRVHMVINACKHREDKVWGASQTRADAQTYRGFLDRSDRPETPCYKPPLPIHMDAEARRLLSKKPGLLAGPEDPNGLPADHPDLVWWRGVRYKHVLNVRPPPLEIRQWSMLYNLPVGLHTHWPIVSSAPYGGQHLEISPERREYLFRETYTDYPFIPISSLKRPRADERDEDDERPAKRMALLTETNISPNTSRPQGTLRAPSALPPLVVAAGRPAIRHLPSSKKNRTRPDVLSGDVNRHISSNLDQVHVDSSVKHVKPEVRKRKREPEINEKSDDMPITKSRRTGESP
ncbi:hypothetical protein PENSPDRAFT_670873 [Peniophora sp. CONT]|nr:hypothetical protein PENSPDRAFT_670873 [Peniophora sp. CONT]